MKIYGHITTRGFRAERKQVASIRCSKKRNRFSDSKGPTTVGQLAIACDAYVHATAYWSLMYLLQNPPCPATTVIKPH